MLSSLFHIGSGAGDQLFRFIASRTIAEEKGFEHGMAYPQNFKCASFMNLPPFKEINPDDYKKWNEKDVRENGADIRSYDPEINFVEDNTIIDGSFEDSKYFAHNLDNINKWLAVEPLEVPDTTCIIGFRGGEYAAIPELFLPPTYYREAIERMGEGMHKYQVHTDDVPLAQQFFRDVPVQRPIEFVENYQISHSKHTAMAFNWRSARFAKYAIIPNSAFFILPRLLKHHEDPSAVTYAPRFWAGRNVKQWRRPSCWYRPFLYI